MKNPFEGLYGDFSKGTMYCYILFNGYSEHEKILKNDGTITLKEIEAIKRGEHIERKKQKGFKLKIIPFRITDPKPIVDKEIDAIFNTMEVFYSVDELQISKNNTIDFIIESWNKEQVEKAIMEYGELKKKVDKFPSGVEYKNLLDIHNYIIEKFDFWYEDNKIERPLILNKYYPYKLKDNVEYKPSKESSKKLLPSDRENHDIVKILLKYWEKYKSELPEPEKLEEYSDQINNKISKSTWRRKFKNLKFLLIVNDAIDKKFSYKQMKPDTKAFWIIAQDQIKVLTNSASIGTRGNKMRLKPYNDNIDYSNRKKE